MNRKIIVKTNAKYNHRINKYTKRSSPIPKSSESFVWKDTDWKHIELRLNVLQNKIYAAKRNYNIRKVRKLQRLILNSYEFKKLAVRKVTQLNRGKKTAGVDDIKNLNEKQRVWLVDNLRIIGKAHPVRRIMIPKPKGGFRPLGIPTMYLSLTSYVLNETLDQTQKNEIIQNSKTDYVTMEHLNNNMLITEFYQKSDQITLFHTETTKRSWYKFW